MFALVDYELEKIMIIKLILYLLGKLPYRSKYGLNLADTIMVNYYWKYGKYHHKCLCGGDVKTLSFHYYSEEGSYVTNCLRCGFVYAED